MAYIAPMPWSSSLITPIALKDGRSLRTLREACDMLLALNDHAQGNPWCQYAAQLLLEAADSENRATIAEATVQMRRPLVREGML